MSDEVIRIILH